MSAYQRDLKQTIATAPKGNKPVQQFRAGVICVSVWENEGKVFDGKATSFLTISTQRSYKDKSGEWAHTDSMRVNDIPVVQMLQQKAFEYAKMTKKDEEGGE